MSLIEFDIRLKGRYSVPEHEYEAVEYHHANVILAIVNQRKEYSSEKVSKRKAGAINPLAFRTLTKDEVDAACTENYILSYTANLELLHY